MAELFDRAVALHGEGRLAEAEQLYRQLVASEPDNVILLINWGHALNGLRQFVPALAAYDRALALDSGLILLHLIRGDVLQLRPTRGLGDKEFRGIPQGSRNLSSCDVGDGGGAIAVE